jgi:hypothetical protein
MSANAIWYEDKDRRFYFDGMPVRVELLGRLVANALVSGAKYIDFSSRPRLSFDRYDRDHKEAVSVAYVQEMLAFVGKHGWFWDCLDTTGDHAFDNTRPTPGTRWGEAQETFRMARECFQVASDLYAFARSRESSPAEKGRARRHARRENYDGRQLLISGWLRLMPGISKPPFELR